jgi:hypothetical protein
MSKIIIIIFSSIFNSWTCLSLSGELITIASTVGFD